MRCTKCGWQEDKVIDSRTSKEGSTIRRRRECLACGHRFTTYEQIEHEDLMVIKRDGRAEEFSREKLLSGIRKACQKRPVSAKTIEDLAAKILDDVCEKFDREAPSSPWASGSWKACAGSITLPMCGLPVYIGAFRKRVTSCWR